MSIPTTPLKDFGYATSSPFDLLWEIAREAATTDDDTQIADFYAIAERSAGYDAAEFEAMVEMWIDEAVEPEVSTWATRVLSDEDARYAADERAWMDRYER